MRPGYVYTRVRGNIFFSASTRNVGSTGDHEGRAETPARIWTSAVQRAPSVFLPHDVSEPMPETPRDDRDSDTHPYTHVILAFSMGSDQNESIGRMN